MTCQHCQTWILDGDHRCGRCGRRIRSTPTRVSPATYPIAASATAPAYDLEEPAHLAEALSALEGLPTQAEAGQQALFSATVDPRVIPFDSLRSPAERDAIRMRAVETRRFEPISNSRIEAKRSRPKRGEPAQQRHLEFQGRDEIRFQPRTQLVCNAPVAPAAIRLEAALIDALIMAFGCAPGVALFLYQGGHLVPDRHMLPFAFAALLTVPLFYKLLWAFAGRDSAGTRLAGLELVDFDGRRPSKARRYQRLFGSVLSLLAAGIGIVWTLVDEDRLSWHDHISATFPTFSSKL